MNQEKLEATIKSTEAKLETFETQRRELEDKVEQQRATVALLKQLIQDTHDLEAKSSK